MAVQGDQTIDTSGSTLPSSLSLTNVTRLSWELGSRIVSDVDAVRKAMWVRENGWKMTVYDVTDETVVLEVQTPLGRQHYYGTAKMDFTDESDRLDAAQDWKRQSTE